jgi:hypothetical protein
VQRFIVGEEAVQGNVNRRFGAQQLLDFRGFHNLSRPTVVFSSVGAHADFEPLFRSQYV